MNQDLVAQLIHLLFFAVLISSLVAYLVYCLIVQVRFRRYQNEAASRMNEAVALSRKNVELSEQSLKNQEEMIRLLRKMAGE